MKIINRSQNTIYVEEIDFHIQYKNNEIDEIPSDLLKRSKALRGIILNDFIEIISINEAEKIETSVLYLKNKTLKQHEKVTECPKENKPQVVEKISNDIEVKIKGIFYDPSGYAKVNRNFAIKLSESGIKVKVDPKNSVNQLNSEELKPIVSLTKTAISKNHISIDSIIPSFAETSSGKYNILYTTIESYSVPKQFLECCQLYKEIWVTSPWAKSILEKYVKDKPIFVVPAGVDETLYNENGARFDFSGNAKSFIFISVFGWNYRKGYDVLLNAYFDEFDSNDDVSLLIVSRYQSGISRHHKNKIKDDIDKIMSNFPNKNMPHVVRYSKVIPEVDMPKIYRAANAFILTSRGEGSNLCGPEASLCGLPVIITNCSGQTMYAKHNNSYLIDIDSIQKAQPGTFGIHYWDNQEFPLLTSKTVHNQTKQTMRHVFNNYQEAKQKNTKLQKLILNNYTWTHTANTAIQRLNEIKNKL